jgi:hypothetical protein
MATHEIGIRINLETGLAFFGVEEVNQRIASGQRVLEIRPGGAIMTETGSKGENAALTLSGCQFQVIFADS